MKIKKGDNVIVIAGKDKGKKGKVLDSFPAISKIVVEGVAIVKKHVKSKKSGKGQTIEMPAKISVSNVMIEEGGKPVRVGYKMEKGKKVRISKKTGKNL